MTNIAAVLIDGGFFVKRMRHLEPHNAYDAKRMADCAWRFALLHLSQQINGQKAHDHLYRIFFYDCEPVQKKMHNPISRKSVDFSKSDEAVFRLALHKELIKKRKVALRLGKLSSDVDWIFKPSIAQDLLKGRKALADVTDADVILSVRQKGVDMRIALDISSITLKKQANRIVLISGDSDFVPAAKFARREGIDFILDPMWQRIPDDLNEHIDGLRSVCKRPTKLITA